MVQLESVQIQNYVNVHELCASCQCVRRVSAFVVSVRSSCQCVRRVSVVSVRITSPTIPVLNKKHVILTFQIEFCICVHSSVLS